MKITGVWLRRIGNLAFATILAIIATLSFEIWSGLSFTRLYSARVEFAGTRGTNGNYVACPRFSLNGVCETARDRDGDGRPDKWTVQMARTGEFQFVYRTEDNNGDGEPETMEVEFGEKYHVHYQWILDPKTAKPCGSRTEISVAATGEVYTYIDSNGDSKIDSIEERLPGKALRKYRVEGDKWTIIPENDGQSVSPQGQQ